MSGGKKKADGGGAFAEKLRALKEEMAAAEKAAKAPGAKPSAGGRPAPGGPGSTASKAARPGSEGAAPAGSSGRPTPAGGARPPAGGKTPPPPAPSADDALSFHRLVSGVTPLDAGGNRRVPRTQVSIEADDATTAARRRGEARDAAAAEAEAVRDHLRALVEGGARFELRDDGRNVEGRRPDVPDTAFRALRRGNMPIDGRLDLHGLGAGEAREELEAFLRLARARSDRSVLVIHGKGDHAPRGTGVLRGEVAAWLAQGRASEHVAAFATARPEDGGEGAVYVLLRR